MFYLILVPDYQQPVTDKNDKITATIGQINITFYDEPGVTAGPSVDSGSTFDLPISLGVNDIDPSSLSVTSMYSVESEPLTEGVDFTIDYESGHITFLSSGSAIIE